MKRLMVYIIAFLLSIGLFLSLSESISAQSISELEAELEELEQERQSIDENASDAEEKIAENERRQGEVSDRIAEIDEDLEVTEDSLVDKQNEISLTNEEINRIETSITETEGNIEETEDEIDVLGEEIEDLLDRIANRDELIKERLRSIQHNGGNINYLQVLFGAQNFGDFINRATAVNKIMDSDRHIMEAQQADKEDLEAKRTTVEEKQEQLVADKEKLDSERAELEGQRSILVSQEEELSTLQAQLNQQRNEQMEVASELEDEHNHLEELTMSIEEERQALADQEAVISQLMEEREKEERQAEQLADEDNSSNNSPQTGGGGGSAPFIWPAQGRLSSGHGWRDFNGGGFHNGIDIANEEGTPIYAAASGRVTRSAYSQSYGNVIYIYHPDINMSTVYAHLHTLGVSLGQTVSQGQQIGTMGNTGRSFGDHLHFEVHNGQWSQGNGIDPIPYLP
ncbi:murein hydrolase activator EnvC family protein [Amphibacillus cookii]|uniref:murein hydrolase activator EnvC family protein n=1 Tax=Amphibacillus cookii TaxID=767787 RepID=UPI00195E4524|nr:M23 family metallopeptidase [Amphibacillus cookii]MBM7541542.1 murein DD-endopeptidase MepM/ murein hydrolase activator NlpD [Amphibacillus cookii]